MSCAVRSWLRLPSPLKPTGLPRSRSSADRVGCRSGRARPRARAPERQITLDLRIGVDEEVAVLLEVDHDARACSVDPLSRSSERSQLQSRIRRRRTQKRVLASRGAVRHALWCRRDELSPDLRGQLGELRRERRDLVAAGVERLLGSHASAIGSRRSGRASSARMRASDRCSAPSSERRTPRAAMQVDDDARCVVRRSCPTSVDGLKSWSCGRPRFRGAHLPHQPGESVGPQPDGHAVGPTSTRSTSSCTIRACSAGKSSSQSGSSCSSASRTSASVTSAPPRLAPRARCRR